MRSIRILLFCLAISGFGITCMAQDDTTKTGWKSSIDTDLTITQASYSDSWVGGDAGTVNWVWNLQASTERQLSPRVNFKTTLRLKFGQNLTQDIIENDSTDEVTKRWEKPKKSTDLIDWENVARFTLDRTLDPYISFRVESQFLNAQVDARKIYFDPLRITEGAGIAREFYKTDTESIVTRLGLALRQTMTTDVNEIDLSTSKSTEHDGGIESISDATLQVSERIQYVGKLTVFRALFSSDSDDNILAGTEAEGYWKAVDFNFESTFTSKVSEIISVNLYVQLLYDKEISKKMRLKETLALGFVLHVL
jgi:hypothetical protein